MNLDARLRCSGCKTAYYCSEKCQKKMWKMSHKSECSIQQKLNEVNEEQAKKLPPRPRSTHCTGCRIRYDEDYGADQVCPDCGYTTCESCSSHNSRGSCYCPNSNFGHKYCEQEPKWYQMSSHTGKLYRGDYHPESVWDVNPRTHPELFEDEARTCNNCGEIKRCLKKDVCN
ncbi:set and mynd domain-containing protein 2 [Moniliophthora roreri MCA 2997]|uniref:Set and mynd domain-containing protein 2 n=1 Tax=Moniliophthora roreri (strain MCA 2997) TaxID=1381753 RepID=V2WWC7_MONRO|nr:set and mynd domain-containing protein 2 [Moniliophthora roreri MCA 2997]